MKNLTRWHRLSAWLVFSVIVGLLPLGFDLLAHVDSGRHVYSDILSRGQLSLVAVVVAGGSLGEVVLSETVAANRTLKIWTIGSLVVLLALQAGWYADTAARASATPSDFDTHSVVKWTSVAFFATVVAGASAIWLSCLEPE